jgi:histone demethylase JARID1
MAEACNFALPDWIPFGRRAVERYRSAVSQRTMCFSHEQLLCNLARYCSDHSVEQCGIIVEELRSLISLEEKERAALAKEGCSASIHLANESDPRYECSKCRAICYLSAVICRCSGNSKRVSCLRHYRAMCSCPVSSKLLVYWYKLSDLNKLLDSVVRRYLVTHLNTK